MKRIALIVPKGSKYGKNQYLKEFLKENNVVSNFYGIWETPNLGLLTIAGVIPDHYEVTFIDEDHGMEVPFQGGFDIVAVTGMTQQINRAYEITDEFRKNGSYTVIGGIHATVMPDEALAHADSVFIGEGENTWREFLRDFEHGQTKKIYASGQFIDLDTSPVPRYDLLDTSLYSAYSIQTTRGCPRTCSYCTLPIMYGSTYRHKSVAQILREVDAVQKIAPNSFIFFADDNMFIQREYSKELLRALSRRGISWGTQTDISVASDDGLLRLMYDAGCHWIFIGFETVSKKGLDFLDIRRWKSNQLENYERSIERIHENGLNIWGSFMFGGDNDDESVFEETLQFTLRNGLYSGSFTILTPLPGTPIFRQFQRENRIIDYDWSRYTFWDVVFKPTHIQPKDLALGVAWVYNNFYSTENVKLRTAKIKDRLKKRLHRNAVAQ